MENRRPNTRWLKQTMEFTDSHNWRIQGYTWLSSLWSQGLRSGLSVPHSWLPPPLLAPWAVRSPFALKDGSLQLYPKPPPVSCTSEKRRAAFSKNSKKTNSLLTSHLPRLSHVPMLNQVTMASGQNTAWGKKVESAPSKTAQRVGEEWHQ